MNEENDQPSVWYSVAVLALAVGILLGLLALGARPEECHLIGDWLPPWLCG